MDFQFERDVREKIQYRPRLIPLFDHALNIPQRLYEYDSSLFVCFNRQTQRYEVHSLNQELDSFCATLPYKDLDARTLRWIWKNDIRVHGKAIFHRIEKSEDDFKKRKDREFHNWVEDVASETQSMIAKDAWAFGT